MNTRLLIALLLVGTSCTRSLTPAYEDPALPPSQVATLTDSAEAQIFSIDGSRAFGGSWAIVPQEHQIWLKVKLRTRVPNVRWTIWSYCRLVLVAAAGEEYAARIRTQQTVAPGLADKVQIEVGIVDGAGKIVALPESCRGKRPKLD